MRAKHDELSLRPKRGEVISRRTAKRNHTGRPGRRAGNVGSTKINLKCQRSEGVVLFGGKPHHHSRTDAPRWRRPGQNRARANGKETEPPGQALNI